MHNHGSLSLTEPYTAAVPCACCAALTGFRQYVRTPESASSRHQSLRLLNAVMFHCASTCCQHAVALHGRHVVRPMHHCKTAQNRPPKQDSCGSEHAAAAICTHMHVSPE
jgi:hypothetical protein